MENGSYDMARHLPGYHYHNLNSIPFYGRAQLAFAVKDICDYINSSACNGVCCASTFAKNIKELAVQIK